MTWYAFAYIVFLIAVGIFSAYDDIRGKVASWYVAVDAVVTTLWIYFVIAYFHPQVAGPGPILVILLVFAVVWTVLDVRRELQSVWRARPAGYDPELSSDLNLRIDRVVEALGVVFGLLVGSPAIIAAIAVARRAW
jgi:hypothetical protein